MTPVSRVLHRYVAPFMAGACMAAAALAATAGSTALLIAAAAVPAVFSFPAGARLMRRIAGAQA